MAEFAADLDIYMGNGGSPVFSADTHQVVGIVTQGDPRDLRQTSKGWASIIYPNRDIGSGGPKCTRVSQFNDYIDADNTDIDFVESAELEGTGIIPVIVNPCRFSRDKKLSKFHAINNPLKRFVYVWKCIYNFSISSSESPDAAAII
ncbi:MAG: hypothetical protein PVH61_12230 [Candidatus Aminicenantes bacterium]|jgi:hypothetical protein